MRKRNWTDQQLREALATPGLPVASKEHAATRHVHPSSGKVVVVDNVTGEIFHVGDEGYDYED